MHAKNLLIAAALFYPAAMATAALPPLYQSTREISRLIENGDLQGIFGSGRGIVSIARTREGYLVKSTRCSLQVVINYLPLPQGMMGAAKFEFQFPNSLVCQP